MDCGFASAPTRPGMTATITILITGFGPFPGTPFNPTAALVRRLARLRRPGLRDVRLIGHVFETRYDAVDRELSELVTRHRPDALLMFGVATRRKRLSIETRARNALALAPDAGSTSLSRHALAPGRAGAMRMPAPAMLLLSAAKRARVPAALSHDAGRYLCNYLCWRAAETVAAGTGPRLAAFVHVPQLALTPRQGGGTGQDGLVRAGEGVLMALVAAARR
jgi:pyroglutamyl-peptidase